MGTEGRGVSFTILVEGNSHLRCDLPSEVAHKQVVRCDECGKHYLCVNAEYGFCWQHISARSARRRVRRQAKRNRARGDSLNPGASHDH